MRVGLSFSNGVSRGVSRLVSGVGDGSLTMDGVSLPSMEAGGSGRRGISSSNCMGSDDFLDLDSSSELLLCPRRSPRAVVVDETEDLEEVVVAVEDRRKSGFNRALSSAIMASR